MTDKQIINNVTAEIAKQFNIPEWSSEKGKKKRTDLSIALKNAASNINKLLLSSLNNKEKAKKVRDYLKGAGWVSGLWGVWKFITESSIHTPKIDLRNLSIDFTSAIELGPTFWLKVAILLFALRIIHKIISSGVLVINDFVWIWKWVKNIFKENVINESYMSFKEYKQCKILFN